MTVFHDPAKDRLLFVEGQKARSLDGVSTATPQVGESVEIASMAEATAPFVYGFDRRKYIERFGLKTEPQEMGGRRNVLFVPRGDAFELSEGRVYRIGRDGMSRAADFGPADGQRGEASLGPTDVLLYKHASGRFQLSRVPLGAPRLDVVPERIGVIASEHDHAPFVFSDGGRAFLVSDAAKQAGLVRIPRGGAPAPVEWLHVGCLPFADAAMAGADRFAFRNDDNVLVEVGPHDWHVVDRQVTFGARVAWSEPESCWSIESDDKKRCVR